MYQPIYKLEDPESKNTMSSLNDAPSNSQNFNEYQDNFPNACNTLTDVLYASENSDVSKEFAEAI